MPDPTPSPGESGLAVGNVLKRSAGGRFSIVEDRVSIEEPLEIQLQGRPLAVTMRTPGHDPELAAGFCFTEGLARHRSELNPAAIRSPEPNRIDLFLASGEGPEPEPLRRYGTIQASCGICGTTSIEDVLKRHPPISSDGTFRVREAVLLQLPEAMHRAQRQFEHSGGLHASALFTAEGDLLVVREDIGRHNALDKLAGWALFKDRLPANRSIVLVSGRTSFELVQKTLAIGAPLLAGVSAPSSLAVNFARDCGITLVGFLREDRYNVYTHPQRLDR